MEVKQLNINVLCDKKYSRPGYFDNYVQFSKLCIPHRMRSLEKRKQKNSPKIRSRTEAKK